MLYEDYKDMLECLLEENVGFLLVGDKPTMLMDRDAARRRGCVALHTAWFVATAAA